MCTTGVWRKNRSILLRLLYELRRKGMMKTTLGTPLFAWFGNIYVIFSSKVEIYSPKTRCPFILHSLLRCSLIACNVLSFLTQEKFLNPHLHPFLSPKYMPSDLGISKRHYSFLK